MRRLLPERSPKYHFDPPLLLLLHNVRLTRAFTVRDLTILIAGHLDEIDRHSEFSSKPHQDAFPQLS